MITLKINSYDPGEFKIKKNDKLLIRMHTSPILIEQKITIKGSDINHINHIFLSICKQNKVIHHQVYEIHIQPCYNHQTLSLFYHIC